MWILLMTLISSIDCIFAGMSYSVRGIRIPFLSKVLIFLTALFVGCATEAASVALAGLIPQAVSEIMGQIVLAILGFFMLATALFEKKEKKNLVLCNNKSVREPVEPRTLFKLVIKSAGITIQILKHPSEADIDRSGRIDPVESVLLSLALTLDSIGLILCSVLIHQQTFLFPVALSVGQVIGLMLGGKFGNAMISRFNSRLVKYLPAVILILIAGLEFIR